MDSLIPNASLLQHSKDPCGSALHALQLQTGPGPGDLAKRLAARLKRLAAPASNVFRTGRGNPCAIHLERSQFGSFGAPLRTRLRDSPIVPDTPNGLVQLGLFGSFAPHNPYFVVQETDWILER
ncbi:MAG: hypothetical protein KAI66_10945 [Lentisphaeria bacterium]|nr:hypothetical protein [Lentisphaeria bacterium]